MTSVTDHLKARARILHRNVQSEVPGAVARVRAAGIREPSITRAHCLSTVARELGFNGWPHLVHAVEGRPLEDFGTLLYPPRCFGHWNIWCASYEEAKDIREAHGGYLLAYKKHYLVVDRHFIESLGLDADDPDWALIGRDWVRPVQLEARNRLLLALTHGAEITAGSGGEGSPPG